MSNHEYWFAKESRSLANDLMETSNQWLTYGTNFVAQSWVRNLIAYYSPILTPSDWTSALSYEGEQGELIRMVIPHARNLVQQSLSLTCRNRLAFKAVAESRGMSVAKEARLASSVCQKIIREQDLETKRRMLAEHAMVLGMGWMFSTWETDKGELIRPDFDGSGIFSGDLEISVVSVLDVTWDVRVQELDKLQWINRRRIRNRYDLIAQRPELKQEILNLPPIRQRSDYTITTGMIEKFDDAVYVWEAYHVPSPSLPEGRMIIYGDSNTIFYDGPNIYGKLPCVPVRPETVMGMGYGYPSFSNLLAAGEMLDTSISSIATNNAQFAVQSVIAPREGNVGAESMNGMNYIFYTPQNVPGGGKPEALQLTQSSPETFKFVDMLYSMITDLSSLNSAVRGNPPAGVTSGTAIATLTANALEFLDALTGAMDVAFEKLMRNCFEIYQKFNQTGLPVVVYGKNRQASMESFTGRDIDTVKDIEFQRVNPLMRTLSGRISQAETLLQNGLIKKPQEYFGILDGEPLDVLYAVEQSESDLEQAENDRIMKGEVVRALITDDHAAHMRCHSIILNDTDLRANPDDPRLKAALDHIMEHAQLMLQQDPMITAAIRTGQMPQVPMNMVAPAGMNAGSGPAGQPPVPPEMENAASPAKTAENKGPLGEAAEVAEVGV
jgi:hypothetical protein